jgi:D-alanyl-D-alanine carboxypeptidase (penicillin-binding protein 5/6)
VKPAHGRRRGAPAALVVGVLIPCLLAGIAAAIPGTVPPPTPVPPRGSLSPFPSVLQTPADAVARPPLTAASVVLADLDSGQILLADGQTASRAIASLTKVMTAIVVLERAGPDEMVTVTSDAVFGPHDYGASSTLGLRVGERISVRDLLYGMLLGSANDAAVALADHVAGSVEAFVRLMNKRAKALGLRGSTFVSPDGLDDRARSTASDVLRLTRAAYRIPLFAHVVAAREHDVRSSSHAVRHIQSRNALLWLYPGAIGAKTGTTAAAGECLVAVAQRNGTRLAAVVLGSPHEPFSEAAALLNYGFEAFDRSKIVTRGQPEGTLAVRGGSVPVVAGDDLTALVAHPPRVRFRTVTDRSVAFPPAPGERIGTLRVSSSGFDLGTVPLLAAVAALPPPPSGMWWARAGESVARAVAQAVGALG